MRRTDPRESLVHSRSEIVPRRRGAPRPTATLALALNLVAAGHCATARASLPTAVYTVPAKVELLPDEANATRVVLHGAFFFRNSGNTGYDAPACGYMYFQCQAGQEVMCRMQWQDLKSAVGQQYCAGFGSQRMPTTAPLRSEGTALASPDPWDLGMGISPGTFVDGKCQPAMQLTCRAAPADLGAPPDLTAPPPPPDLTAAPPRDLTASAPTPDFAAPPVAKPASGCALDGRAPADAGWSLAPLGALFVLLGRRRRLARAL